MHDEPVQNSRLNRRAVRRYDSQLVFLNRNHERAVGHGADESQTIALTLLDLEYLNRRLRMRAVALDDIPRRNVEVPSLAVEQAGECLCVVDVVHEKEELRHHRLEGGHPVLDDDGVFGDVVVVERSVRVGDLRLADHEGATEPVPQL